MTRAVLACAMLALAACNVYDPMLVTRRDADLPDVVAADTPPGDAPIGPDLVAPDAVAPDALPDTGCGPDRALCGGACVDLQSDPAHCGACGASCGTPPNAAATCVRGACVLACAAGFADCDGVTSNGCEANLQTDATRCGTCATMCSGATNATPVCEMGTCRVRCLAGFDDCDGVTSNGCEASLTAPTSCGTCANRCPLSAPVCSVMGAAATCSTGCTGTMARCGASCVDTRTDPNNCGACGNRCPTATNATATCVAGACGIACAASFGDCDRNTANGCETSLATTTNCGACGTACPATGGPFTMPVCTATTRTCATSCATGRGDCDAMTANGCEAALDAPTSCGACGQRCTSTQFCAGQRCCAAGQSACAGACVSVHTDEANCGACGTRCAAGQTCCGGRCVTSATCSGTYSVSNPLVSFVDVCAMTGAHRRVLATVDDGSLNIPEATGTPLVTVPFQVRAYNTLYSPPFTVATNGWLSLLGSASLGSLTSTIPSASPPYMVVAPFWVDLVTRAAGICYATVGAAPNRRFVVQWEDVRYYPTDDPAVHLSFEVVINEAPVGTNNTIDVIYRQMAGVGRVGGMGIQNATGAVYTALPGVPAGPTAVRYTYTP